MAYNSRFDAEGSVFYHDDDPNDPFIDNPNQIVQEDDYFCCPACNCAGPDDGCRCSCHNTRRYH